MDSYAGLLVNRSHEVALRGIEFPEMVVQDRDIGTEDAALWMGVIFLEAGVEEVFRGAVGFFDAVFSQGVDGIVPFGGEDVFEAFGWGVTASGWCSTII